MPVRGESSSVVPDSTLSSSPPLNINPVKRPTRTYGRSRPADANVNGLDSVSNPAESRRLFTSIYRTGPRDDEEEIPQTSDPTPLPSDTGQSVDAEDESFDFRASPKYRYAWQVKLQEIDEEDNFLNATERDTSNTRVESNSEALSRRDNKVSSSVVSASNGDALTRTRLLDNSDSALSISRRASSPQSPPSTLQLRKGIKRFHGTDGKSDVLFPISSLSPSITTPKTRSPLTHPTFDDDMHVNTLINIQGKGKANTSVSPGVLPDQFSDITQTRGSASKSTRSKKQRIKAPTKKELAETAKDRVRIAAEQQTFIPRTHIDQVNGRYTMSNLFASLRAPPPDSDADPIADFSSDTAALLQENNVALLPPILDPSSPQRVSKQVSSNNNSQLFSDKGSELPEVGKLLEQEKDELSLGSKYRELVEAKKRLVAANVLNRSDEVEDLQIVPVPDIGVSIKEDDMERKYGQKKHISEGRKRQLRFGGSRPKTTNSQLFNVHDTPVTQAELNMIMATRAEDQRQEIVRHKEEEWKRRGGKVKDGNFDLIASMQEATKIYVQRGLNLPRRSLAAADNEESDEEWAQEENAEMEQLPNSSQTAYTGDERYLESAGCELGDEDITMVNERDSSAETDEEGVPIVNLPAKHRSTRNQIVESDSEAEESAEPAHHANEPCIPFPFPNPSILLHRGSVSSMDGPAEDSDEGDKENKKLRMWDRGEDKENTTVVQRTAMDANPRPLDPEGRSQEQSMSPLTNPSPGGLLAEDRIVENRRPFRDLLDQDPFTSSPRLNMSDSFEARLRRSSPKTPALSAILGVPGPLRNEKSYESSQFTNDGPKQNPDPQPLQPSFLELFGLSTEKQGTTTSKQLQSDHLIAPNGVPGRMAADILELTQDIALQPAFRISGNLLRKADVIFDREQEFMLEAATKNTSREPELYIDDHGFLTQTKPNSSSPEIYKRLPGAQNTTTFDQLSEPNFSQRHPPRTLSLSEGDDPESPFKDGLSRLHKRPTILVQPASPSLKRSPGRPVNAFDMMRQASRSLDAGPQRRLEKSDFVEREAEESDDDEMLGFGPRTKANEEEEDGEDLDQTLTTLVDDQEMDQRTVAPQLVFEKYKEQEQADDQEIEKLHQAAIHGELRKKRRDRGVGMDDSDDDSDEDEANQKIRRSMHKKQKIDRDNIKELGEHMETKAFFNTYENDLLVDASDFSHLRASQSQDIIMDTMEEEKGEDEVKVHEFITREEFVRQVRKVAQQPKNEDESLDPHDVSWVDGNVSDDEGDLRIRPATLRAKKRIAEQRRKMEQTDLEIDSEIHPSKPAISEGSLSRMQSWANVEGRSRGGLGRNPRPAAVTHMAKSRGRPYRALDLHVPAKQHRVPKAQPSVLVNVAEERRTTRFG